ncbi:hypothetical protein C2U70_30890 [Bradyrhizobium guangdongense]|uniref:DUF6492 family protein n=1 Tax=Bradyrhizobium guangdongense TaxID=1325090 RepID=UPI00112B6C7C|nr:DUF6492 family protein [Bradyrhizobium guangdongense]TPQ27238.1 hypothetical protein C2U70_30890 [Bradyrhizobium guangdongense]
MDWEEKLLIQSSIKTFAIVTPTYLPDLKRCELLAESLDRTSPDVPHYLIVDRRDYTAFKHLEGRKRHLIESEALLGRWIWRMPGRKGLWFSLKAPPVRGWIIQQILKIAAVEVVSERTLIFCDSDTAFLRNFHREDLLVDGKIGLLDVDFAGHHEWTVTARHLLGLPRDYRPGSRNHVGNMICWNSEVIRAMQQRIEASTGVNWMVALARTVSFSEYMIYGVFVSEVLGYDSTDHAPSSVPLVKPSWHLPLSNDSAIEEFFANVDPRTVAVMIHSKTGIDPAKYRKHLASWWSKCT